MIHDIDLVLDLLVRRWPTCRRSASPFSANMKTAQARIMFANGSVADLSANRVSPVTSRKMQVWGTEGCVQLDFASREAVRYSPGPALQFGSGPLERARHKGADIEKLKADIFGTFIEVHSLNVVPRAQLTEELLAVAECVMTRIPPMVGGEAALEAMLVAGRILDRVAAPPWTAPGIVPRRQAGWRAPILPLVERKLRALDRLTDLSTQAIQDSHLARHPRSATGHEQGTGIERAAGFPVEMSPGALVSLLDRLPPGKSRGEMKKTELVEFRDLLEHAARGGDVHQLTKEASGPIGRRRGESKSPTHMAELGSDTFEQDFSLSLAAQRTGDPHGNLRRPATHQGRFVRALRKSARKRGKSPAQSAIPKPRLRAIPYARTCLTREPLKVSEHVLCPVQPVLVLRAAGWRASLRTWSQKRWFSPGWEPLDGAATGFAGRISCGAGLNSV
jgi:hypothetical protein